MKVFSPKAMHFRLRTGMVFFVFFMFQKVFSWRLRFDEKFHFFEAYRSRISWKNNRHLFFNDLFFILFSHNVKIDWALSLQFTKKYIHRKLEKILSAIMKSWISYFFTGKKTYWIYIPFCDFFLKIPVILQSRENNEILIPIM